MFAVAKTYKYYFNPRRLMKFPFQLSFLSLNDGKAIMLQKRYLWVFSSDFWQTKDFVVISKLQKSRYIIVGEKVNIQNTFSTEWKSNKGNEENLGKKKRIKQISDDETVVIKGN